MGPTQREWQQLRARPRQRQIAQEAAMPCLYAPLKGEDAIEAELTAVAAEEIWVTEQANEEILRIFAAAEAAERSAA
jgi:hypothetical protein